MSVTKHTPPVMTRVEARAYLEREALSLIEDVGRVSSAMAIASQAIRENARLRESSANVSRDLANARERIEELQRRVVELHGATAYGAAAKAKQCRAHATRWRRAFTGVLSLLPKEKAARFREDAYDAWRAEREERGGA